MWVYILFMVNTLVDVVVCTVYCEHYTLVDVGVCTVHGLLFTLVDAGVRLFIVYTVFL